MLRHRASSKSPRPITSSNSSSALTVLLALRTSPPSFGAAEGERIARELYGLAVSVSAAAGRAGLQLSLAHRRCARVRAQDSRRPSDPGSIDCLVARARSLGGARSRPARAAALPHADGRGGRPVQPRRDRLRHLPDELSAGRICWRGRRPDAPLLHDLGATLARVDRALQGFFHPPLRRRLAWDVRRLPELAEYAGYIESAALASEQCGACAAAFRTCLPRLRGLRSQAIHGDCHAAQSLGGCRRSVGQRHSGFRRHDSCAADIRARGGHVGAADRSAGAAAAAAAACCRAMRSSQPLQRAEVELLYDIIAARHAVTCWCTPGAAITTRRARGCWTGRARTPARSLHHLLGLDRQALTRAWHEAPARAAGDSKRRSAAPGRRSARGAAV